MEDDELLAGEPALFAARHGWRRWASRRNLLYFGVAVVSLVVLVVVVVVAVRLIADDESSTPAARDAPLKCSTKFRPKNGSFVARMHAETRKRMLDSSQWASEGAPPGGAIVLRGGTVSLRYDTDVELPFRQESNFIYVTGVHEPDYNAIVDRNDGRCLLFVPKRDYYYRLWNGVVPTKEEIKSKYQVDEAYYNEDFEGVLRNLSSTSANFVVYTLPKATFPGMGNYVVNHTILESVLMESRSVKTDMEIEVMRIATSVSADAHKSLMKRVEPSLYEYSLAGHFVNYCYLCGFGHQAYPPIIGAGYHSAILHYTANSDRLDWSVTERADANEGKDNKPSGNDNNLILVDAGGEYLGYGADITRTYPLSGTFDRRQRQIYEMVLRVQTETIRLIKPGAVWKELQHNVRALTCKELQRAKMVKSSLDCDAEDPSWLNAVVAVFLPHGFGHLLGLDVHDTYVYPTVLEKNMVVTVEPGIYFNQVAIDAALANETLADYLMPDEILLLTKSGFGGVRIEDDVLVTSKGHEVLSAAVPKTVGDIQALMR